MILDNNDFRRHLLLVRVLYWCADAGLPIWDRVFDQ